MTTDEIVEKVARAICRQPGSLCVGFCHADRCKTAMLNHEGDARAALAAIQSDLRARHYGEWQPIDSAPKDEWILVYMPNEVMGKVHAARNRKIANGYSWIIGHHFGSDCEKPTHWMKLPEPPISRGDPTPMEETKP